MKDIRNILVLLAKLLGTATLALWLIHGTWVIYTHVHIIGIIVAVALIAIIAYYARRMWIKPIGNLLLVALGVITVINVILSTLGALLNSGWLMMGIGALLTLALVGNKTFNKFMNGKDRK